MKTQTLDYQRRIDRVLDYVSEHPEGDLSLDALAGVACFSPFHFHRIFNALTGETVNGHVRRVRLERAAKILKASPRMRLTEVALASGFAGLAEFSRAFKAHFGMSPSRWDRKSPFDDSKARTSPGFLSTLADEELEKERSAPGAGVRLTALPAWRFAYVRTQDPYGNQRLVTVYHSLIAWLRERGTDFRDVFMVGMSMDDPTVTPGPQCRYDMGVAFPVSGSASGFFAEVLRARGRGAAKVSVPDMAECERHGLSLRDFEPCQIATVRCTGDLSGVTRAWQYIYGVWLPRRGYEPLDRPAMEMFVRIPEEIGWEVFDLECCIAVRR
jgi:AraC family transcriptional regulator